MGTREEEREKLAKMVKEMVEERIAKAEDNKRLFDSGKIRYYDFDSSYRNLKDVLETFDEDAHYFDNKQEIRDIYKKIKNKAEEYAKRISKRKPYGKDVVLKEQFLELTKKCDEKIRANS